MTSSATADVQEEQLCGVLPWRTGSLCPYCSAFIILSWELHDTGDQVSTANEQTTM